MGILVSEIVENAQVYLNSVGADTFTGDEIIPHIREGYDLLKNIFFARDLNLVRKVSAEITVALNTSMHRVITGVPNDVHEPEIIKERGANTEEWTSMRRLNYLHIQNQGSKLRDWAWIEDKLWVPGCTTARTIVISYIKLPTDIVDGTTEIEVGGADRYLAAYAAQIAALTTGRNSNDAMMFERIADKHLLIFLGDRQAAETGKEDEDESQADNGAGSRSAR